MRKLLLFFLTLAFYSCSHSDTQRNPSSAGSMLSGDHLGIARYNFTRKGPNNPAIRLYLSDIEGEPGSYNAVLIEYINALHAGFNFAVSKVKPTLKHITRKIETFKVVPNPSHEGVFDMYELHTQGQDLVAKMEGTPRQLILTENFDANAPLKGAKITSNGKNGQPIQIYFPADHNEKDLGLQYRAVREIYIRGKLKSTWRKAYLPGPYLSTYAKKDDVVLKMSIEGQNNLASFVLNPKYSSLRKSSRVKMFTNPKSAYLKGDFEVSEPRDGMFLFKSTASEEQTKAIVEPRIGLFIDVFDATESRNEDVVEFVLINTEDPEDILMYFEDPDNGEGQGE
jgi:hypothetical protein